MALIRELPQTGNAVSKPTIIALHCSGATGAEWQQLERNLGDRFTLHALDLIGCGKSAHWSGAHAFRLTDEAARVVKIMDAADGPVHLVGHSYGGAVALRAAIERSTQVASLSLYEPVAFHVLGMMGPDGRTALDEITTVATHIAHLVSNGANSAAAECFIEYWNGKGSWSGIRPNAQAELARYIPKACLEFSAAIGEHVPLHAYRRLYFPVLLMQGEHAPRPTHLIAWQLAKAMRFATLQTIAGAGHMGPFSHVQAVSALIEDRIVRAETRLSPDEGNPRRDIHKAA